MYNNALAGAAIFAALLLFLIVRSETAMVIPIVFVLFGLGLPHGAAISDLDGHVRIPDARIVTVYIVSAAALLLLFMVSPAAGLISFLTVSAIHFGKAERAYAVPLGPLATFAAFLLRPGDTRVILAAIMPDGQTLTAILLAGQLAALGALFLLALRLAKERAKGSFLRAVAILFMFALLPPLMAMGLYFLMLHSVAAYRQPVLNGQSPVSAAAAFAVCGLPALVGAVLLTAGWLAGWVATPIIAAVAFAFALPHMLIDLAGGALD